MNQIAIHSAIKAEAPSLTAPNALPEKAISAAYRERLDRIKAAANRTARERRRAALRSL